jgi:trans-aconitate 2-methyltransferase
MATGWDPDQYLKFASARLRPAIDLLAQVAMQDPRRIVDLGCGPGNSTQLLRTRWPSSMITGVDGSAAMLAQAAREVEGCTWAQADLADWQAPEPADLIFSNAALHWVERHDLLFPRLLSQLRSGGVLAVQMPDNFAAPSHTLIAETVKAGPWRAALEPLLRPTPVHAPSDYFELLEPLAENLNLWETQYLQALRGADPVKEWVKGTWLKPLLDALAGSERLAFEGEYARRVRNAYPPLPSGVTLFPFKRLFLIARKRS